MLSIILFFNCEIYVWNRNKGHNDILFTQRKQNDRFCVYTLCLSNVLESIRFCFWTLQHVTILLNSATFVEPNYKKKRVDVDTYDRLSRLGFKIIRLAEKIFYL